MNCHPIRLLRLMLVLLMLLPATACGQKGKLYHPEDGQSSLHAVTHYV